MIDVNVEIRCDGCNKRYMDDGDHAYCFDCYEKLETERDRLLAENEELKRRLGENHIDVEPMPHAPCLYPEFAKRLKIAEGGKK
jgi:hypothetical protein